MKFEFFKATSSPERDKDKELSQEVEYNKIIENNSSKDFSDSYQEEVLPLIEILRPDSKDLAEWQEQVSGDLLAALEKRQMARGELVSDPEDRVKEAREILIERLKAVLNDARDYNLKKKPDEELVKKAKIALLYLNDLSDAKKYFGESAENKLTRLESLHSYIIGSRENKFSEADINSLLKTPYASSIYESWNDQMYYLGSYGTMESISEPLMIALLKSEERNGKRDRYYPISTGLEMAEKGKYSEDCLERLLASGYESTCIEFVDKFSGNALEKIISAGLSSDRDILEHLLSLDLSADELKRYVDLMAKQAPGHKMIDASGKFYNSDHDVVNFYPEIIKGLRQINVVDPDEGINNDAKNYSFIKELISSGYIGLLLSYEYRHDVYMKRYISEDYQSFYQDITRHNQEHLVGQYLKEEDKIKYAYKLVDGGEEFKLVKYKDLFSYHSLGPDIFRKIEEKGLVYSLNGDLKMFRDLGEREAQNLVDTYRVEIFIDNIESFNVSDNFLQSESVQKAGFIEFDIRVNSLYPYLAGQVSSVIPLPQDKLDQSILKAIYSKWQNNNHSVREIISAFPNIKEHLDNQTDRARALDELNMAIDQKWLRDVAEMMESFPLDKELSSIKDLEDKCLEMIEKNIPSKDEKLRESVDYFFTYIEKLSRHVNLPDYLQKQKELIDSISKNVEWGVKMFADQIIKRILKSHQPEVDYNYLMSLIKEVRGLEGFGDGFLLNQYFEKFKDNDDRAEKDKFIVFAKAVDKHRIVHLLQKYHPVLFSRLYGGPEEDIALLAEFNNSNVLKHIFPGKNIFQIFEFLSQYEDQDRKEINNLASQYQIYIGPFKEGDYGQALFSYIDTIEELRYLESDPAKKKIILEAFEGRYKDTALQEASDDWRSFLADNKDLLPPKLFFLSSVVNYAGGAGNLKHFEALSGLMHSFQKAMDAPSTVERSKVEIKKMLLNQEERFEKEKISQDDRSEFYGLSRDIIEAAPSLFSAFAPIFETLPPKEAKVFAKEIFPLYHAQLIVIQNIYGEKVNYQPKNLVFLRQSIKDFAEKIKASPDNLSTVFAETKQILLEAVKHGFADRFGLQKIPNQFSNEDFRSMNNLVRYLGNINGRNNTQETILSFYLGLQINKEWESFRRGDDIAAGEYLADEKLNLISPLLEKRQAYYQELAGVLGINADQLPAFQQILQEDVLSNMVGNIQTVDVKLENIKNNIYELNDPDIYEDPKDREMMALLSQEGRTVGTVLAKTYGQLDGKRIYLSEEEENIKNKIAEIFEISSWSKEEVKKTQDHIQPLGLVSGMIRKMEEEELDKNVSELKERLLPSARVIEIFNRLGEDFKQDSGAMALSKDLSYLENLLVKDSEKISPQEKEELDNYLELIRDKMKDLEVILGKIKDYFIKIKSSSHLERNKLLENRILDIEKIVNSSDDSAMIVSHLTKDLNIIIENMRQCLGCLRKEANNDTNLSFGDYNKFFIINQGEKIKGSISDQIVYLFPAKISGDREEMTFVLDRLYGSKSADILISNVLAVYKKYSALKNAFPQANLSISISKEAISSVNLDTGLIMERLSKALNKKVEIKEFSGSIDIKESVFSDNYIEFGNSGTRDTGSRDFSGVNVR